MRILVCIYNLFEEIKIQGENDGNQEASYPDRPEAGCSRLQQLA